MSGRFRSRPTRHTGVRRHGDWRIKWYEITLDGAPVSPKIVQAAHATTDAMLAGLRPATGDRDADARPGIDDATGVGFAIIHHGAESVWLLVDRWDGDIISQHTWSADFETPTDFRPVPVGGPTACVWELAVHSHERDAFIRHVLDPPEGPQLDNYLSDVRRCPDPQTEGR